MGDSYNVRFDKHGHMIIEDPELERRIRYLLRHERRLVMRLRGNRDSVNTPGELVGYTPDPTTDVSPQPILLNRRCPNSMCICGLQVVDEMIFTDDWKTLGRDQAGGAIRED